MLVLDRNPVERMVTNGGITDVHVKSRMKRERHFEKNAIQRADHRERDDRLRLAAMKVLQSSSYSALRRLRCEAADTVIAVRGVLPSYFLKQMAQSAIQQLEGVGGVTNLVEVRGTHSI